MKPGFGFLWQLGVPVVSRGINFLMLPFTLLLFDHRSFVSLSYAAMLVAGISIFASLGNAPRILEMSNKNSLSKAALVSMATQLIAFWLVILFLLTTTSLDWLTGFTKMNQSLLILTFIEGIVMGLTNDIPLQVLRGKQKYTICNHFSLMLIILLGPLRILLVWVLGPTIDLWISIAIFFRIVIFLFAFYKVYEVFVLEERTTSRDAKKIEQSLKPTIFGNRNLLIILTLNMWVIGSVDRFMIHTLLSPTTGAGYQVAYQCASTIGLVCYQLMYLQTHKLLNPDKKISIPALSRLLSTFGFVLIFSLPIMPILFKLFFSDFSSEYLLFLIGISFSQFLWAVVQVQLLLSTSKFGQIRFPLMVTLGAIFSQLVLVKLILMSDLALLLPLTVILGSAFCCLFFNNLSGEFAVVTKVIASRRLTIQFLVFLVLLSFSLTIGRNSFMMVEIILSIFCYSYLFSKRKRIIEDWDFNVRN